MVPLFNITFFAIASVTHLPKPTTEKISLLRQTGQLFLYLAVIPDHLKKARARVELRHKLMTRFGTQQCKGYFQK